MFPAIFWRKRKEKGFNFFGFHTESETNADIFWKTKEQTSESKDYRNQQQKLKLWKKKTAKMLLPLKFLFLCVWAYISAYIVQYDLVINYKITNKTTWHKKRKNKNRIFMWIMNSYMCSILFLLLRAQRIKLKINEIASIPFICFLFENFLFFLFFDIINFICFFSFFISLIIFFCKKYGKHT